MDTSQVDLSDRSLYRSGFPHALFAGLREEAPVFLHESTPGVEAQVGHPFWVTTRMEPARWMSKDLETFSSVAGPSVQRFPAERQGTSLISTDGFVHARLRRLVNRGFTPRMVGRLQDQIQGWADRIVEGVAERGQCEFVSEVAYPLPMHLIADIVGIPESDRQHVFDRVSRFMSAGDPLVDVSPEEKQDLERELFLYAGELTAEKRRRPADDIWTKIVHAEIEQEDGSTTSLSDLEMQIFFQVLAIAGSETTRNAISAGLLAWLDHPEAMQRFMAEPDLRTSAAQEIVRWTSPVVFWARDLRRDIEIEGQKIPAGDRLSIWLPSANRDPRAFTDPDRFDIARKDNHHAAFGGGGAHYCLGANLALRNIQVLFATLFSRLREIELAGEPRWNVAGLQNNVLCSLGELPIRFRAS